MEERPYIVSIEICTIKAWQFYWRRQEKCVTQIGPELLKLIDQVRLKIRCVHLLSDIKILSHLLAKALLDYVRSLVILYNEFNTEENW